MTGGPLTPEQEARVREIARPHCEAPNDCRAKGNGHCRSCHFRALNADPEFAAANAERMRKLNADPEFAAANAERNAERMRKLHADPEFAAKLREAVCVHWTPEMDAALRSSRADGVARGECAERLDVARLVCRKRMVALGLAIPPRGRPRKQFITRAGPVPGTPSPDGRPPRSQRRLPGDSFAAVEP